ncbi:MAG: hypothetical protein JO095_07675, partial [Alphaproteobacteria bacterium]|nr:hypothetical protein [Alphaproteobacteria bacterium]
AVCKRGIDGHDAQKEKGKQGSADGGLHRYSPFEISDWTAARFYIPADGAKFSVELAPTMLHPFADCYSK